MAVLLSSTLSFTVTPSASAALSRAAVTVTAGPPSAGAGAALSVSVVGGGVAPPTLRVESAGTAGWVRTALVEPSRPVMTAPLRRNALAGMLIPSPSQSSACTVYWKSITRMPTRILGTVWTTARV